MATVLSLIYFAVLCALVPGVRADVTEVDLSDKMCDQLVDYVMTADDIIYIHALYQSNFFATHDECNIRVITDQRRRIEYTIDAINITYCGVEIRIFSNKTLESNPIQVITCKDNSNAPIYRKTNGSVIWLSMVKTSPQSGSFSFGIRIKNDLSFPLDSGNDAPKFVGDGMDVGVIAGVAVAGVVLIVALILLAIYCCVRARNDPMKDQSYAAGNTYPESSVYTSGTSQALFTSDNARYPKGKYGSMEDIKSSASSQEKSNGAYANPAYTKEPGEKQNERQASVVKARGKAGFTNDAYDMEEGGRIDQSENSWEEREMTDTGGSRRMSRKDASDRGTLKSAMKKRTAIEMSQVNTQSVNGGILKTRAHSPNRSHTSSTDASLDANIMVYGYTHQGKDQPNVKHKPVIERKRSRSGTRSHRSGSSGGHSRRSQSPDKTKVKNSRMYGDVFIDDRSHRSRSSGRRARSDSSRKTRSERTSDSQDSGSSTASQSRKVSMNPGGKRVHIKGEETDI